MNRVKLGGVIKICNGRNYSNLTKTGKYPVYGSGGLMGYTENFLYEGKSVLLPRKGTLNNIQYVSGKFWTVDTIYFSKLDVNEVDPYFLYYYLKTLNLEKLNTGTGVPSMTQKSYEDIPLLLPELDQQKSIANFLQSIDRKIELNNHINAELERMAKNLYDYWFVQFDFPDENDKPYKTNGGRMAWNEKLKRHIPEGWVVKYISDLLPVLTGKHDANYATENGKYNFFTCGEKILKCGTYEFEGKSILLAGNGNFSIKLYEGKFNAYQRTYVLIPNNNDHYMVVYLAVKDRIKSLTSGSRGSIVKFITKGDIENIALALPESGFTEQYDQLNTLTKRIELNISENQELTELRDWLLPMLINGQVKVYSP